MKNPPFTPGPWTAAIGSAVCWVDESSEGVSIAKLTLEEHLPGNLRANAELMAAAPDLFAALERAAVALGGMEQGAPIQRDKLLEIIHAADAALLKAGWAK